MKQETYPVKRGSTRMVYEFVSEGPQGRIPKIVVFTDLEEGYYNLAFGDKLSQGEEFSDKVRSNNGDTELVLTTVAAIVFQFLSDFPGAFVAAEGSTPARTRLYRMGIARFWEQIPPELEVFGLRLDRWEHFRIDVEYVAFGVRIRPP